MNADAAADARHDVLAADDPAIHHRVDFFRRVGQFHLKGLRIAEAGQVPVHLVGGGLFADQRAGQRQLEDVPQLAVDRILVAKLLEMRGETPGELQVQFLGRAGVNLLALGGKVLIFAFHLDALAAKREGQAVGRAYAPRRNSG